MKWSKTDQGRVMLDATLAWLRLVRRPSTLVKDTTFAYRAVFDSPDARNHVLPDLAEFCFAASALPQEHDRMLLAAGRREVWLRLQAFLNMSNADLYAMLQSQPHIKNRGVFDDRVV